MSQSKQLGLRPAHGTSFVQGWPGVPAAPGRPAASVTGHVDVRLGKGLNASWLRVELRKLESIPGGEHWGELIGSGPLTVWRANAMRDPDAPASNPADPDADHWQLLTSHDFSFRVPVPEALPPSARIDKQSEVAYELVASLCVRMRRGVFRKKEAAVSSIIQTTHPVVLQKHDLHPPWFLYNYPDTHETQTTTEAGPVKLTLFRNQHCFGPGDSIDARVALVSEAKKVVKPKHLTLTLKETVTFKGSPSNGADLKGKGRARPDPAAKSTASQRITNIATRAFPSGKKLTPGESRLYDISLPISKHHALMTISTAKHIEVSYTLRLALEVGKQTIVIDHLPIKMSSFPRSESEKILPKIGYVQGLSDPSLAPAGDAPKPTPAPAPDRADSVTMSTLAPGPHRSNTLMSTSTGLSWALSGPNVAGRGIGGAFEATRPVYPDAQRMPLATVHPNPVRAAFAHQGLPPGLNGPEQLALTNQIDRGHSNLLGLGPEQVQGLLTPPQATPGGVPGPAAEAEKERLYTRAAQASHTTQALDAAARAGTATQALASAQGPLTAEEEKSWRFNRARAEAEAYQATFGAPAPFLPSPEPTTPVTPRAHLSVAPSLTDQNRQSMPSTLSYSSPAPNAAQLEDRPLDPDNAFAPPAVTPAYLTEKEQLRRYLEARDQVAQQQGDRAPPLPAGFDPGAASSSATSSVPGAPAAPALTEKEQLRRFLEARDQVAQQQGGMAPPLPEELASLSLATPTSSAPVAGSSSGPALTEKEQLRRFLEARDQVAQQQGGMAPPLPDELATHSLSPLDSSVPAPGASAGPALTEKEQLRRFLEARDQVAQQQGGMAPPLPEELASLTPATMTTSSVPVASSSSVPALTEKEQLRRFLEARDRVASQQGGMAPPLPEEIAASPPSATATASSAPVPGASAGPAVLTEKEQLRRFLEARDQVAQQQGGMAPPRPGESASSPPPTATGSTPQLASSTGAAPTEKEQLRRFLEARDQVAQQQAGMAPPLPEELAATSTCTNQPETVAGATAGAALTEKEQLRRYMEAQDAVATHQRENAALGAQQAWAERYTQYETTPVPTYDHVVQSVSGSPVLGSPVVTPPEAERSPSLGGPGPQTQTQTQAQAQTQAQIQTLAPAQAPPALSLKRASYDAAAAGGRGAVVLDRTLPRGMFDPQVASSPWGSLLPSGPAPQAPPRPPKI